MVDDARDARNAGGVVHPVEPGEARAGRWVRRADGVPVRLILDPDTGRLWTVWLARYAEVPGALAAACLIFDAGPTVCRVWDVPPGWEARTDAALLALLPRSAARPA